MMARLIIARLDGDDPELRGGRTTHFLMLLLALLLLL